MSRRELKAYTVSYDGLWLGGHAVVLARDRGHALRLVERDRMTVNFDPLEATIERVDTIDSAKVLWNDNGNY